MGGYEVYPSGAMRHPYFIRMRPDLNRHDANLEKVEIKENTIDWVSLSNLLTDWMEKGSYLWVYQILKDQKNIPKSLRTKLLELAENPVTKGNGESKYYLKTLLDMLDPIGHAQKQIDRIKSGGSKLPDKNLKLEWAVGDDRFYEMQFGDHRMMHDNITKMPKRVIKKKKKIVKESWASGTDRRTNNTRLADPDNATGSYELDDTIKPKKKIKNLKKSKNIHKGIE